VIAVIAILATIAVVMYNGARERAVSVGNAELAGRYADAVNMYEAKNGHVWAGDTCLGKKPAGVDTCGGFRYEGPGCAALGVESGTTVLGFEWKTEFDEAMQPYMDTQSGASQVGTYEGALASEGGCNVMVNATAAIYQSFSKVTVQTDGQVLHTYSGNPASNNKAYAIMYRVPGDAVECPIPGSRQQEDIFSKKYVYYLRR
jgi:hypothetical protein